MLWSHYPIVWLLGTEGFAVASPTVEVFLFLILDILAEIGSASCYSPTATP